MIMQNRAIASVLIAGLLFGLPGRSEAQSAGNLNGRRQPLKGFDVSNAVIPTSEIRSGGPPREGIPAIDRPSFLRPSQVNYLSDDDLVVSVTLDGKTRAYPLRILVRHEIVNDQVGQSAFVVTYCPLCGTAMVFDRSMGGRTRSFGVSGLLYQSDVLINVRPRIGEPVLAACDEGDCRAIRRHVVGMAAKRAHDVGKMATLGNPCRT